MFRDPYDCNELTPLDKAAQKQTPEGEAERRVFEQVDFSIRRAEAQIKILQHKIKLMKAMRETLLAFINSGE